MISPTFKPLKVAIVGCGLIGNKRAQVLYTDPESRLCAAADPDMACAEALWAEFCFILGREIFILKMGEPVRILDLARDVIRFNGFELEKDIEIVFTGLRPGEKLYEELITEGEGIVPTRHEKIMVLAPTQCNNHDRLPDQIDELIRIADTFDVNAIKAKLKEIVPEFWGSGL